MASLYYQEIVQKLQKLEPEEVWLLLAEIQTKIKGQPKRNLTDFDPTGMLVENRNKWEDELRRDWDDR